MRAIWKGAVSFGLVSIAVKLYAATEEKNIRFNQVHREDGGRIKYQRICAVCGAEVAYDEIAKGYDLGGGQMVILDDEDFADLPLSTSRAIDVLEFVPADQVDPILFAKAYYLEPENAATKPYVLLRDALLDSERVAIVKVALRQREQLATLRVRDGVMVLNTMLWPDEVRQPEFGFLDDDVTLRPAELAMAGSLIESMAADFDPDEFNDDYRTALQAVIDAKAAGEEVVEHAPAPAKPTAAVDLMAALKASVDRAKAARGAAAGADGPARGAAAGADRPARAAAAGADRPARGEAASGRAPSKHAEPTPITAAKSAKKAAADKAGSEERTASGSGSARKAPAKKTAAAKKTTAKSTTAKKTTAKKTTQAKKAG